MISLRLEKGREMKRRKILSRENLIQVKSLPFVPLLHIINSFSLFLGRRKNSPQLVRHQKGPEKLEAHDRVLYSGGGRLTKKCRENASINTTRLLTGPFQFAVNVD
jgi:hypothetical protein